MTAGQPESGRRDANSKGQSAPLELETHGRTRAMVLVPVLKRSGSTKTGARATPSLHSPEDRLAEAIGLAQAIDLQVAEALIVTIPEPRPSTLFGAGKTDDLAGQVKAHEVDLVIVDHAVTPIQQRNLEKAWSCKVLDRTGLILEIFGRRAQTREGSLQVELAHLTYQRSRLVRSWTHLERQRGGFGFLGGPGETQIETDRRLIQERIVAIRKELDVVVKRRELHRRGRSRVPYPIVAIVGYTNAGKSTLFNRLTGASVLAKDQVFATLDPTMRELVLPSGRRVILSDTVGFISDLPTMLVAAFRATLEEVLEADLILHVRDISHAESEAQLADVNEVLSSLGVATEGPDAHIIEVWNKVDLLGQDEQQTLAHDRSRRETQAVMLSALSGAGLDTLVDAIDERLGATDEELAIRVDAANGALRHWLHANTHVLDIQHDPTGDAVYCVRIEAAKKGRLLARLSTTALTGS